MQEIIVIGNRHSANLMYEYLRFDRRYAVRAFAVDAEFIDKATLFNLPVIDLGNLRQKFPPERYKVLMAVGYKDLNRNREKLFKRAKDMGYEAVTFIHPDAKVYSSSIGDGCLILPNVFIDVYSEIGPNSVIWGNCSVAHHAKIGANCWLATGCVISGSAEVAQNSFIGLGAIVVNNVKVGKYNIIGAGSLVIKDTRDFDVYVCRQTERFRLSAEDYLKFSSF